MESIDGATGKSLVFGEEVAKDFLVVVAAVGKNRDGSCYVLVEGVIAIEEALGDAQLYAGLDGNDLVIFEQLLDATEGDSEKVGNLVESVEGLAFWQDVFRNWY